MVRSASGDENSGRARECGGEVMAEGCMDCSVHSFVDAVDV